MRYQQVDFCIYCGDSTAKLTDEHIIPFGLGGVHILPKSSCKACATLTSKIELQCLRDIMGQIRAKRHMPSRRKKNRPTELPVYLSDGDNSGTIEIKVGLAEHPTILFLGKFPIARCLVGIPYYEYPSVLSTPWFFGPTPEELIEFAEKRGKRGIGGGAFEPGAFSRMLCKIALGFAVGELGSKSFAPLVLDQISGKSKDINHLVGGSLDEPPPAEKETLHSIRWEGKRIGWRNYVVVYIRLFADLGAPIYHVVVGEAFATTVSKFSLQQGPPRKPENFKLL